MEQVLSDVKVLDLTWYIAGSYCTKLLADYGADVIKVERTNDGDPARKLAPFFNDDPHPEKSGLFLHLNTNKKSITLDLKSEWGKRVIKELVKEVDILVEGFSPRVMPDLGLDYETLEQINPKLVMTSISNFGQTGPYRDFKASELIIYGMGGAMFCNGLPEEPPLKKGLRVTEFQGGIMAAVATMMALLLARETGVGQHVDVSLLETQLGTIDRRMSQLLSYQYNKAVTYRGDPLVKRGFPFGIYPCDDGYFELSGVGALWPAVGKMMDMPELIGDPRFCDLLAQQMPGHREQFDEIWYPWIMTRTKKEIVEKGQEAGALCGPLVTMEEVLNDPHFRERGFFQEIDHPMTGKVTYPGPPINTTQMPWVIRNPAPLLGQHNEEIYGQPHYSKRDLVGPKGQRAHQRREETEGTAKLPLEGVRVVEVCPIWAGPFACMLLADWGAEVIRVESRQHSMLYTRGRMARPPLTLAELYPGGYAAYALDGYTPDTAINRYALFNAHARNKLGMTVDLTRPEGKDIFKRLVGVSDIVIESQSPRVMEHLGLTYDVLKEVNPDLVMVSLPAFGQTGPYKYYRALGAHQEGFVGHTYLRGYADRDFTTNVTLYQTDETGGATCALAALMALHRRRRTGMGMYVDMSQSEATIPILAQAVMEYTMNGRITERMGNRDYHGAIQGCYRCWGRDDWVNITISNEEEWQSFWRALGEPEWTRDEKFSDHLRRCKNHDELDGHIEEWTRQRDKYDVMHILQAEGVPAGPVMDERDAYTDPHIRERGFFNKLTHADTGTDLYPGLAWRMSKTPNHLRLPPVRFGEHNEYIYRQVIGVSDAEYKELVKEGHIGTHYIPEIT